MNDNTIFYRCKNIEEQLIVVIREILKLEFKNVTINIPKKENIDYVLSFFNKRKFKYSTNKIGGNLPVVKINNSVNIENEYTNFYIMYDNINYEENFIDELKKINNELNIVTFINLTDNDKQKLIENKFKIYDYRKSFKTQVKTKNTKIYKDKNIDKVCIDNHLVNNQIRNKFIETFFIAEKEIDIISPWISECVVDEQFIELMESALRRNVKIKILYGIGGNLDERNKKSETIASVLINKFQKYGDLFKIKKGNIHYKLLLCDEKFLISGSYNFLSFKGDYEGNDNRIEGAEYIKNEEDIKLKRDRYFSY